MLDQLIERASLLFQQQRYGEAQKILLEVLAQQPDQMQCLVMLIEIKIKDNELKEAMQLTEDAIATDPEFDVLFYLKARIHFLQEQSDLAIENLLTAMEIDPFEPNNFAFLGHILLHKKKFAEALENANAALELDATNIFALNVRSTALLKLNLKDDSFQTIEEALNEDPNNSYTHANYGWGLLEKGNPGKALDHFAESLKNDPNSDYAQAGMAQALKAKYLVYRWFLKYSFWMNNLTSKNQWVFIIGFYIISRVLRGIAANSPSLQPFLTPLIVLLAIFAFSTWVMQPLSNLLFRLNRYGKYLLDEEEKKSANLVGISLLVMLSGLTFYLITSSELGLVLTVFGFTMMLPLGSFYNSPPLFFKGYAIGLFVLGLLSIAVISQGIELMNIFSIIYLFAFIGFQWAANYFAIKRG